MSALQKALSDYHRKALEDSRICEDVIKERGYRTVTNREELIRLGFSPAQARPPGLLIPVRAPGRDEVVTFTYRPDTPRGKGGKQKYECLPKQEVRLDVPSRCFHELLDITAPLWITEGSKKADSAASWGLCCVAILGVWNWKAKTPEGGSTVLGDFEAVPLLNRTVYLAFDSDAWTKPNVKAALLRFVGFLKSRGAIVYVIRIPSPDTSKVGLDDYFAKSGTPEQLVTIYAISESELIGEKAEKLDNCGALLELVEKEQVECWRDADGQGFATFTENGVLRHAAIQSTIFSEYLSGVHYRAVKRGLTEQTAKQAQSTLEAKARYEGEEYRTALRMGTYGAAIYLHLADKQNRIARIMAPGWDIIGPSECPIRFVTVQGMRPLPEPIRGGNVEDIRQFVNVDDEGLLLVIAFLVACFCEPGAYPVLMVSGEQGSGKSFACSIIRRIIDPAKSPLRKGIRDTQSLAATVANNFLVGIDNLSGIPEWLSDSLCSIATGVGLDDRKLYTNLEEVTINAKRPMILNGIADYADKPDLLDRAITLELPSLSEGGTEEEELELAFTDAHAGILGGLLDRVAHALSCYQSVEVPGPHRLKDSVRFVLASVPEGKERDNLWAALQDNRSQTQTSTIENDGFAQALIQLVEKQDCGYLHNTIGFIRQILYMDFDKQRPPKGWPQTDRGIAEHLKRIAPSLRSAGYIAKRDGKRTNRGAFWLIGRAEVCKERSQQSQRSLLGPVEPEIGDGSSDGWSAEAG